jgi:hypothetical protein
MCFGQKLLYTSNWQRSIDSLRGGLDIYTLNHRDKACALIIDEPTAFLPPLPNDAVVYPVIIGELAELAVHYGCDIGSVQVIFASSSPSDTLLNGS